jgi:hypothetical protein
MVYDPFVGEIDRYTLGSITHVSTLAMDGKP